MIILGSGVGRAIGNALLKREGTRTWMQPVEPRLGTVERALAQTPKIERKCAFLPTRAPWLETFENEIAAFPMSKFFDQVDSMVHFLSFLDVRDRWTLNLSAVWDHREQPFQVRGVHNKRRLQSALGYQTATAYPWRRPTSATATRVQRRCPTIRARSSPARPIGGDRFVMRSTRNAARRASSRPPCGDPTNGKHWRGSRPGTSRSIGCTVGSKRSSARGSAPITFVAGNHATSLGRPIRSV